MSANELRALVNAEHPHGNPNFWDVTQLDHSLYIYHGLQDRYDKIVFPDISYWDTSNMKNLVTIFQNSSIILNDESYFPDISTKVVKTGKNSSYIAWDVSNATNMSKMFKNTNLNPDISNWNVSNVTNMYEMFSQTNKFNQNISRKKIKLDGYDEYEAWDTSNLKNASGMFQDATSFD